MVVRSQLEWLQLRETDHSWSLVSSDCLRRIVSSMPDAKAQFPSLVLFMGRATKAAALRELYPENNLNRHRSQGLANLRVDNKSRNSEHPILFGEVDIDRPVGESHSCHKMTRFNMGWSKDLTQQRTATRIFARLLLSFANVLCIFADDFPRVADIAASMTEWAAIGSACKMGKPKLLILTSKAQLFADTNLLADASTIFSGIEVVELRHAQQLSPAALYSGLRASLRSTIAMSRSDRKQVGFLFSAAHLTTLFERALERVAVNPEQELDVITLARGANNLDDADFSRHLEAFLKLCAGRRVPVEHLASAMVLDHHPPGMHCFDPCAVFRVVYREPFRNAAVRAVDARRSAALVTQVEGRFVALAEAAAKPGTTAAVLHHRTMASIAECLATLRSNTTCLCCLRRPPEHVLRCKHAVCDTCIRIFYARSHGREASYEVTHCVLCQAPAQLTVKLVPKTASYRTATFDGGGARGIVSLELFKALSLARRLPYPIQDDFDFAIGTSSGGLIVLLMFLKRRNVNFCLSTFDTLATRVFQPQRLSKIPMCSWLCEFLKAIMANGRYDVTVLEHYLKRVYGRRQRLFDSDRAGSSGIKIAVTGLSTNDGRLCLLTNYNGGPRPEDPGYKHVRPENPEDEVLICDAAQATSAAPSIFPPKYITALDCHLQDGGIGEFNNPIDAAKWEARLIWPAALEPDFVVSTGTGYATGPGTSTWLPPCLSRTFLNGICKSIEFSSESEMTFKRHMQGESERHNKFRLTLPLADVPALDDAQRIPELREKAHTQAETDSEIQTIVQAMLCTQFFLELDALPIYVAGSWEIHASIRCRSPNSRAVVRRLREEYPVAAFVKDRDSLLGPVEELDICEMCGLYRRRVRFTVRDLDEDVRIAVQLDDAQSWSISAFQSSRKMRWFVERQSLDSPFGSADHIDNGAGNGRACGCVARKMSRCATKAGTRSSKPARGVCERLDRAPLETTARSARLRSKRKAGCVEQQSSKSPCNSHVRAPSPVKQRARKRAPRESNYSASCIQRQSQKRKRVEEHNVRASKRVRSRR